MYFYKISFLRKSFTKNNLLGKGWSKKPFRKRLAKKNLLGKGWPKKPFLEKGWSKKTLFIFVKTFLKFV